MQIISAALIVCFLVLRELATVNSIGLIERAILGGIREIALNIITKPLLMLSIFHGVGTTHSSWRQVPLGSRFLAAQVPGCASGLHHHLRREQDEQVAGGSTAPACKQCAQRRSSALPCAPFASSWRWTYDLSTSSAKACSMPSSDACSKATADSASGVHCAST